MEPTFYVIDFIVIVHNTTSHITEAFRTEKEAVDEGGRMARELLGDVKLSESRFSITSMSEVCDSVSRIQKLAGIKK